MVVVVVVKGVGGMCLEGCVHTRVTQSPRLGQKGPGKS